MGAGIVAAFALSKEHIQRLLRQGVLCGYKVGRRWYVEDAEVKRYFTALYAAPSDMEDS